MTESVDQVPSTELVDQTPSAESAPIKHIRAKWGTAGSTAKLKHFECECGGRYFQQNIKHHKQSKRHLHFLETGEKWSRAFKSPKAKKIKVSIEEASDLYKAKRAEEGIPMRVKADLSGMSAEDRIVYRREQKRVWAGKRRAEISDLRAKKLYELQDQTPIEIVVQD
jgi:hypothetical protein